MGKDPKRVAPVWPEPRCVQCLGSTSAVAVAVLLNIMWRAAVDHRSKYCSRITMTDVLTVDEAAARMHDLRTEITDEAGIKRDSYWLEV